MRKIERLKQFHIGIYTQAQSIAKCFKFSLSDYSLVEVRVFNKSEWAAFESFSLFSNIPVKVGFLKKYGTECREQQMTNLPYFP